MRYETIADIYSAKEQARDRLTSTVASISDQEAVALPDDEKWTIQQIVEHISMVDTGISRICANLLEGAKQAGKPSDGTVAVSADFFEMVAATGKMEAPDRVKPSGNVTIAEALERLDANRPAFQALRFDLETFDVSEPKFPHPYFGDMTAVEWLIVAGGHETRHTAQIERLLAKIRN